MPFDALVLRKVGAAWARDLPGTVFTRAIAESGRVRLMGRLEGAPVEILAVLQPGLARVHRVPPERRPGGRSKTAGSALFPDLWPATLTAVTVVPWERIVHLRLERVNDLGDRTVRTLIVELAGHLTNLIVTDDAGRVLDAVRRVPPGKAGRTVFPGHPYIAPPPLPNPCHSRMEAHLPPLARTLIAEHGPAMWERLCRDYEAAAFEPVLLRPRAADGGPEDVWVYPLPGMSAIPVADLEQTLASVFAAKERRLREQESARQYRARLVDRIRHLQARISEWEAWSREDGADAREVGDLWLAHQHAFRSEDGVTTLTVPRFSRPHESVVLSLADGETPAEAAAAAYRRYKKIKSRRDAAEQLLPSARRELAEAQAELGRLEAGALSPTEIATRLAAAQRVSQAQGSPRDRKPYRRFVSQGGYPIWVGRSREENQALTFREARPDDLWFHVKQTPGSHVVLFCGKRDVSLEDLLDAAELAVFYSNARRSSMVPVDYTRRKAVKKRPHGEPGQVFYRQEKTLFITPDPARLRRLGATRDRLGEERD